MVYISRDGLHILYDRKKQSKDAGHMHRLFVRSFVPSIVVAHQGKGLMLEKLTSSFCPSPHCIRRQRHEEPHTPFRHSMPYTRTQPFSLIPLTDIVHPKLGLTLQPHSPIVYLVPS